MDMSYQIVELEEKTVVGLTARMRNDDPECGLRRAFSLPSRTPPTTTPSDSTTPTRPI